MDFTGQVAIVTGASKGLGRAYARWLAAHGCAVVASNRPAPDGSCSVQAVVDEILAEGGKAIAHSGPVQDPAAAQAMVELARSTFGPPDIFISNAGIQAFRDFAKVTLDQMREVLDINLWGCIVGLKAVWPEMLAQRYGRIVLTGSSAGLWGQMQSADYGATKGAMVGLARSVALDVPEGVDICINVIAPAAYTPMSAGSFDPRWADYAAPEKVAPVAGWLSSPQCRTSGGIYHTGAGNLRRVQVLEGPVMALDGDDAGTAMARLGFLPEWTSSFHSGSELLPDIAAAMRGS